MVGLALKYPIYLLLPLYYVSGSNKSLLKRKSDLNIQINTNKFVHDARVLAPVMTDVMWVTKKPLCRLEIL